MQLILVLEKLAMIANAPTLKFLILYRILLQRTEQLIMFAAPVLLVVCEWWLVDQIVDRLTPANGNGNGEAKK